MRDLKWITFFNTSFIYAKKKPQQQDTKEYLTPEKDPALQWSALQSIIFSQTEDGDIRVFPKWRCIL